MPGIFGVCYRDPSEDSRATFARMLAAMRHYPWYAQATFIEPAGRVAFGMVGLRSPVETYLPSSGCGEPVVMLDGEIYDYAERRRDLESAGDTFAGDRHAELLARGWNTWGEEWLRRIEGHFNAVIWSEREQRLWLVNDRFGMKPLYSAEMPGGLAFASEVKALLKDPRVSRQQSLTGVAQFLSFGHFLGEDTLFKGVRAVGAGSSVVYDARSATARSRRYWAIEPKPPLANERDTLVQLDRSLLKAVARRTHGPLSLGLSLSGGMDARTILAAIRPGTASVKSLSIGIPGSIDHRAASRLAELAGAEHHCEFLQHDFIERFPNHLRTLVFLTDGHYLDQAITVPTLPVYRSLGIEALLRGHAGELLHMDKAYAFSIQRRELDFADVGGLERWLWSRLTSYMIGGIGHEVFRPELRTEVAALARQSLTDALARSEGFTPVVQRLWHLFIQERLHRETAMSMQMFNSAVEIRLPYLDSEFVDLTMQVPPSLKIGEEIQSFMLKRRFPAFLGVVNANTGTTPHANVVRKSLGQFRLRMFSKLGVPGFQPYERLGLWLSHELRPFVASLLMSERTLDRGLFDRQRLRQVIDDHGSRRRNHTFLIMTMMIFEIGQRQFVDEDASELPQSL